MSSDLNDAGPDPSQDPDVGLLDEDMEEEELATGSITPLTTEGSKQPETLPANPRGNPLRDKPTTP